MQQKSKDPTRSSGPPEFDSLQSVVWTAVGEPDTFLVFRYRGGKATRIVVRISHMSIL